MRLRPVIARIGGVPVTVRPSILLLVGALAWQFLVDGQPFWMLVCYVVVLLASVLLHEIGHAAALWAFGVRGHGITLHGLGGHVQWDEEAKPLPGIAMLGVFLAGPASGMLVAIVALGMVPFAADAFTFSVVAQTALVGIVLNVSNLVPAIPLDGGWSLFLLLKMLTPRGSHLAAHASLFVSSGIGTLLLVAAYHTGNVFLVLVGGQILLYCAARSGPMYQRP